jgi:hypothetical protein
MLLKLCIFEWEENVIMKDERNLQADGWVLFQGTVHSFPGETEKNHRKRQLG